MPGGPPDPAQEGPDLGGAAIDPLLERRLPPLGVMLDTTAGRGGAWAEDLRGRLRTAGSDS